MKVGLAIIVKDEWKDVIRIVESYGKYFDEIHLAYDKAVHDTFDTRKVVFHQYHWQNDFAHKRNFLRDKCIAAGLDYYFTIDTDDEIVSPEKIREVVDRAGELGVDIVYAPYNYSRDEHGTIDSVHNKERLIKCTKNLYWCKAIHENVLPVNGYTHKIVIDDRLTVNHLATHDDLERSNERNMAYLLEEYKEDKENTDPRTLAYLGRTFLGKREFGKALHFLELHVEKSGWNEDRYLSLCQLSALHLSLEGYQRAKYCALEAMDLLPEWPDAYACLHDVYYHTQHYKKAIYWGEEAIKHKHPETMIPLDPSRFTWRLATSMSYCYMMVDNVEQAYKFFKRAEKLAPGLDYIIKNKQWYEHAYDEKKFLESFAGVLKFVESENPENIENLVKCIPTKYGENEIVCRLKAKYLSPKKWNDKSIVILCGDTLEPWGPASVKTGIGGSEEAVIYLSKELVKEGWEVTVYNNCGDEEGVHDGVEYINLYKLNPNDFYNILISWRSNVFAENIVNAKMKCVWLHDIIAGGILNKWEQIDRIFVLSEYHKSLLPQEIPDYKVIVTRNGIPQFNVPNVPREPFRMIYASSYDRGLENLLNRWKEIKEAVPEAELHIFYGWQNIEKLISEDRMTDVWYNHMKQLFQQEGVYEHGRIGHSELTEEFAKSRIWVYPCKFPEISCITAMRAQACGCLPVTTDYAALKETVKCGVMVAGSSEDMSVMNKYVKTLITELKNPTTALCTHDFSWQCVAKEWTDIFTTFKKKMRKYNDYDEYKQYYLNHGEHIGELIGTDFMCPRMEKAINLVKEKDIKSYLDVGTYDGYLPITIHERTGIKTKGIDANVNHISAGQAYVKEKGLNVELQGGVLLEEYNNGTPYDFVTAHEIIEHVIDTDVFLNKLKQLVKDGGYVSISTPLDEGKYGKYQWNEEAEHVRNYSEESLRAELSKYFTIDHIDNDGEILTALCKNGEL